MADVNLDVDSVDPHKLYARGLRALILEDFEGASALLSRATELLVAHYKDDLHEEMGKVYLDYGKSLLGCFRQHCQPLGDAVPKNSLEESDEDEDAATEEVEESGADNAEKVEDNEERESQGETKQTASETSSSAKPDPLAPVEEAENEAAEEEPTDLELAWDVLELAKKIFEKNGNRRALAETFAALGDIQLENESYKNAIEDMKAALAINVELYGKDSRTVAETLYKIGLAYCFDCQIGEAIQSFKESVSSLTNKVAKLQAGFSTVDAQGEIKEIKDLLPEIEEKIVEMETYGRQVLEKIKEASSSEPSDPSPSSSKKASDISHLVKRKRQSDEGHNLSEEVACKKRAMEAKD